MHRRALTIILVAVAAFTGLVGLPSAPGPAATPGAAAAEPPLDLSGAVPATFTVTPGVEQVTITGATPHSPLVIVDAANIPLLKLWTDDLGQLVISYVPSNYLEFDPNGGGVLPTVDGGTLDPGDYRIVDTTLEPFAASPTFTVLGVDDHPDPSLYESQTLTGVHTQITGGLKPGEDVEEGFQYVEVRDGIEISIMVRFPDPDFYGEGPYPTVVEYSGYGPSNPGASEPGSMIANVLGFASVGVNMRGTGCSGGTFDVFNAAQMADGYDVIETIARQDWVKHNKVGMVGLSYAGITQLYVAASNPPSLAAITPLSVIEDPWLQQWPGGIYNSGFTQQWLAQRDAQSAPGGVNWVNKRITDGDPVCTANMDIRSQNIDFEEFARSLERRPADADARRLSELVQEIDVPVYLTGAWQDEQTGARFGTMLDDFTSVPDGQWKFTMFNGRHPDGYTPMVLTRWFEFLAFYVDQEIPKIGSLVRLGAPPVFEDNFGVPGMNFAINRFLTFPDDQPIYPSFEATLDAYEAENPVRVLFESGASPAYPDYPGAPKERWANSFTAWPPPEATPKTWFLGPEGTLGTTVPGTRSIDRYSFDPDVGQVSYSTSGANNFQFPQIEADWLQTADGKGLSYLSEPLGDQMVIAGNGFVDLWFRSTGTDAGIEVVLSEVYEDLDTGDAEPAEEVIIQTGMLRGAYSDVDPVHSTDTLKEGLFYAENYHPLEQGEFVHLQVPILPVAHPFRAGSRIRLSINTPGADTPLWEFENPDYGATTHDVALGGSMASAMTLSVLPPGNIFRPLTIPTAFDEQSERPPCNSLRGQVCRDYVPLANETVHVDPACDATRFSDVGEGGFCGDITWLSDEEIADGFPDGTYRPGGPITRQAMAAFLYRLAGEPDGPSPTCTEAPFPDVAADAAFCGEIAWMATTGLAGGFPDGNFRPGASITRQAMAAFLYRLAEQPDDPPPTCATDPFPDVPMAGPLCGYVEWLAGTGITTGFEDGTYRPGDPVTRQAMAAFLHRYVVWAL